MEWGSLVWMMERARKKCNVKKKEKRPPIQYTGFIKGLIDEAWRRRQERRRKCADGWDDGRKGVVGVEVKVRNGRKDLGEVEVR